MARSRLTAATSIRDCLTYMLVETLEADLGSVGLHMKLAILEADDVIAEERRIRRQRQKTRQNAEVSRISP